MPRQMSPPHRMNAALALSVLLLGCRDNLDTPSLTGPIQESPEARALVDELRVRTLVAAGTLEFLDAAGAPRLRAAWPEATIRLGRLRADGSRARSSTIPIQVPGRRRGA